MKYSKIYNPKTQKYVSVNSKQGQYVITNYMNQLGGATGPVSSQHRCRDAASVAAQKTINRYVLQNDKFIKKLQNDVIDLNNKITDLSAARSAAEMALNLIGERAAYRAEAHESLDTRVKDIEKLLDRGRVLAADVARRHLG